MRPCCRCLVVRSAMHFRASRLGFPVAVYRVTRWLEDLLWETEEGSTEVLRVKGIVHVIADDGTMSSYTVQAVREIYDMSARALHAKAADAQSRLVLIGRKLDPTGLQAGLSGCVPAV